MIFLENTSSSFWILGLGSLNRKSSVHAKGLKLPEYVNTPKFLAEPTFADQHFISRWAGMFNLTECKIFELFVHLGGVVLDRIFLSPSKTLE